MWYVNTHTYVVSENVPFSTKTPLILLISAFFGKNNTFTQSNSLRAALDIFLVLFSIFVRLKVTINESVSFTDYSSGIRLPDCCKLAINRKNDNDFRIYQNNVIVKFFFYFIIFFIF